MSWDPISVVLALRNLYSDLFLALIIYDSWEGRSFFDSLWLTQLL